MKTQKQENQNMQSINFEFLRSKRTELADLGGLSEKYVFDDPAASLVKLRTFGELMVSAIFEYLKIGRPYYNQYIDLLRNQDFLNCTPPVIIDKFHILRINGNKAAHDSAFVVTSKKVMEYISEAHSLAKWFFISFLDGELTQCPDFIEPIPIQEEKKEIKREKKAVLEKLAAQEAKMQQLLEELETARAEAKYEKKTKEELEEILRTTQQTANALNFDEETTRNQLIDIQLIEAGLECWSWKKIY